MKNKQLKRRIVELSYKYKLSHIGSCLTSVDIIEEIYQQKKYEDKFVLSAGHAHLAHLVVMEAHARMGDIMPEYNAESLLKKYGVHCDRRAGCDVSTGSLGHGVSIAAGMALADRSRNVYCLISDGECSEGSVWEAMRIKEEQKLDNLKVDCNWNGWAAYKETTTDSSLYRNLPLRMNCHYTTLKDYPKWLQGQAAHYKVLNEKEYEELMEALI